MPAPIQALFLERDCEFWEAPARVESNKTAACSSSRVRLDTDSVVAVIKDGARWSKEICCCSHAVNMSRC